MVGVTMELPRGVGVGVVLLVLLECGARAGEPHAPCYNCEFFNIMQADQPMPVPQKVAAPSQCHYPCTCDNHNDLRCRAGVNMVKDGCNCCFMCARQQGDLCDVKDRCDEDKMLYCDQGYCRVKGAKPCVVDGGKTYKDGEEFKPNCSLLCTCQNGLHACSTLCPGEDRPPVSVHCKSPQLVAISNRCCKEWVCPHAHSIPDPTDEFSTVNPTGHGPCVRETSEWSPCSVTCGMGVSMRVTNNNDLCQPVQERRLCLVRPCGLVDEHVNDCKSTWRGDSSHIEYEGCQSVEYYKLKYCSTCKRKKCCGPGRTKTKRIHFKCPGGKKFSELFMWIKSCECHKLRRCPYR